METSVFLFFVITLLLVLLVTVRQNYLNKKIETRKLIEGMADGSIDNEALQNIASLYNSGEFTVTNLKVTGKAEFMDTTTFKQPIDIDLRENTWGPALTIRNPKNEQANISWFDNKENKRYCYWMGTEIVPERNIDVSGRILTDGVPSMRIHSPLNLVRPKVNFLLDTSRDGNLNIVSGGKSLFTLPSDPNGVPVFRCSGLAYTDRSTDITKSLGDQPAKAVNNLFKNDPDRKSNLVFMGGMTKDDDAEHRIVAGGRRADNGVYFAQFIDNHGTKGRTVCPNGYGKCDWKSNEARIN